MSAAKLAKAQASFSDLESMSDKVNTPVPGLSEDTGAKRADIRTKTDGAGSVPMAATMFSSAGGKTIRVSAAKLAKVQMQSVDSKEDFDAESSLARTVELNFDIFKFNHRGKGTVSNAEVPNFLKMMAYGKFQSSLQHICSHSGNVVSGFNQMFQYDTQNGHRRKLKELGLPRSANDPNVGKGNGLRDITRALGPSTSAHLCFDFDGLPYRICTCTDKKAQHCPAITGNLHYPGGRCM